MKTIIRLIVFAIIFSLSETYAQTINDKIVGTWKVIADTVGNSTVQETSKIDSIKERKNQDNMPNSMALNKPYDTRKISPESDIWKFTKDSLYYLSSYTNRNLTLHCTYSIIDSVIYCYGQPTYRIVKLTDITLKLKATKVLPMMPACIIFLILT